MGSPKAWLPFGPETLLQRIVRILRDVVSPLVVVAAVGQDLPDLPPDVLIARDEREALGPVGGLAAGFAALQGRCDAAFATACDVPLLKPVVIRRICEALGDRDLVIPKEEQFHHPLAAVYRLTLEAKARELLAQNRLRPVFLLEGADVLELPIDSLRDIDPDLDSFKNCNRPEDYAAVLKQAGFAADVADST